MMYRVVRTHTETYVLDVEAESPKEALKKAQKDEDDEFEHVESSAYDYEVVPYNNLS